MVSFLLRPYDITAATYMWLALVWRDAASCHSSNSLIVGDTFHFQPADNPVCLGTMDDIVKGSVQSYRLLTGAYAHVRVSPQWAIIGLVNVIEAPEPE